MGLTLAEKILSSRAKDGKAMAGDIVFCRLDLVMATDITTALSAKVFERMKAEKVFDPEKVVLVHDHFVPAKDVQSAELSKAMRSFAAAHGIRNFFEVGRSGICHVIVPDSGLVVPGDVVIGADSHTCTYGAVGAFSTGVGSTDLAAGLALGELWFRVPRTLRVIYRGRLPRYVGGKDLILQLLGDIGVDGAVYMAIEFCGPVISGLGMADRFTICNMAIEAGAKAGIVEADEVTLRYCERRSLRKPEAFKADRDAEYAGVIEYDVTGMEPLVAEPHLPSNVKPVGAVKGVKIDQVVLGSCTNGRIEDFRVAAEVMGGRRVHPSTRMIILPGSREVVREMVREGLFEEFLEAGAVIAPPTCGPCIGGHMGVLASGEKGLYTTNRNFVGRAGARDALVYLAGPAVAAATAVTGEIADPRELGRRKE